jgi:Protein of unknown function (DUF2934)
MLGPPYVEDPARASPKNIGLSAVDQARPDAWTCQDCIGSESTAARRLLLARTRRSNKDARPLFFPAPPCSPENRCYSSEETFHCDSYNTYNKGGIVAKRKKATETSPRTRESMEDEIRSLAFQLYCEGGYQDNRDIEYWLKAEQQVLVRSKAHLRIVA